MKKLTHLLLTLMLLSVAACSGE
ncbi:MAG: hypothetical protein H6Q56_1105, partial [Deltaproteobacteria bacterium]|nr:hypothetical protein [Deltaproteobacteria bacterium]